MITEASRPRLGLATRFALATGGAVAIVILAAGMLISMGVIGQFDAYLAEVRAGRYAEVASLTADLVRERGGLDVKKQDLRRLAVVAGGTITIRDAAGAEVARLDELPGLGKGAAKNSSGTPVSVPIVVDGVPTGTLEILPLSGPDNVGAPAPAAFREAATAVVFAGGLLAVVASMLVALFVARRLVRPIGALAVAARRIEGGDLAVRVPIPADAESHDLAVAFNDMAERLERSEALRRRAASDLAHELATPVTVLAGRLQALTDGIVPPDPEHLAAARDAAEEVRRLVGDLQDLAAAEGASLRREVTSVDLRSLAVRAAGATQALFDQAGVALDGAVDEAAVPVIVEVDERQVTRAIVNLLTNAATYTERGGSTMLVVTVEGPAAIVRVRDTGPGIAAADLPHVFERLYRGDPARGRPEGRPGGTGIGLTVARELIEANGGRLSIESSTPAGTILRIDLPRTRAAERR